MPTMFDRDRHYLFVIGPNAPYIVSGVGGWLFDRSMAGWDVTVFVRDFHDAWPLRILGVRADEYGSAARTMQNCPGHSAFAVAASVYDEDASVRQVVHWALDDRCCEVTIWGDARSTELGARLSMTSHPLGPAAAAFKSHALAAAHRSPKIAASEVFYSACARPAQRAFVHAGPFRMTGASRGTVRR